jgi:hypothetical protein
LTKEQTKADNKMKSKGTKESNYYSELKRSDVGPQEVEKKSWREEKKGNSPSLF